jgi:hypothetical protein
MKNYDTRRDKISRRSEKPRASTNLMIAFTINIQNHERHISLLEIELFDTF